MTDTRSPDPQVAGDAIASGALVLELRRLRSGYGNTVVVREVSLRVVAGEVAALIGSNGAGKSTLLKTAAGLLPAKSGQVFLGGEDVTSWRVDRRVKKGLCLIPEGRAIYRTLTVRENFVMQSGRGKCADSIAKAADVFPILGRRLNQVAGSMSGGEQQMLALAAAYVRAPSVILIDEASLGLAPIIVDQVFEYLAALRQAAIGMLIVDQFAARALALASHAYVLRRGEIVYDGSPTDLLAADTFATYVGDNPG